MTRETKFLLACNLATLLVASCACYFAFDARREARNAAYVAEWSSSGVSDLSESIKKIAEDTKLLSADARAKVEVERMMRGY